ncbi:hypothetical protein FNV43_RR00042 [Rhamnella rubrinervis]|uniref:DUF569 domain-containing protein n=1 Tax=Rhamnella rubrinervis TaxID=2594499 RepID=A0A8K0HM55_9ROSA|nr:hypothetical protein FNV43_RR00040 [Rhamnella rubrinervis]KAF3455417.1 hypothetical protein FNV43_RR00042 [Rhamnella rubrinervis]
MELFRNAKVVKLISYHVAYLCAGLDEESIIQGRNGTYPTASWTVEIVSNSGSKPIIRIKSCYDKYLTASDLPLMLGWTGQKVFQTRPQDLGPSVEWEVDIISGNKVRLKNLSRNSFLRATGGMPPWRNTVTRQIQNAESNNDWNWDVQIVQRHSQSPAKSSTTEQEKMRGLSFLVFPRVSIGCVFVVKKVGAVEVQLSSWWLGEALPEKTSVACERVEFQNPVVLAK